MRVVLDTHGLFHAVDSPDELTRAALDVLEDPRNDLLISAITVWELGLLAHKGRISFVGGVDSWFDQALATLRVRVVPLDVPILRQTFNLPGFDRKDPADRFIVATAVVEDAVLVTRDEWIVKWPGVRTVW